MAQARSSERRSSSDSSNSNTGPSNGTRSPKKNSKATAVKTKSKEVRVKKEPTSNHNLKTTTIKTEPTSETNMLNSNTATIKAEPALNTGTIKEEYIPETPTIQASSTLKSRSKSVKAKTTPKETMNKTGSSKRKQEDIQDNTTDKKIKIKPEASTTKTKKYTTTPKPKVKQEKPAKVPKKKPVFRLPSEAKKYLTENMCGRIVRAMKQRMFVLSRTFSEVDDTIETFEVLGSIGNNYTVTISNQIKCTCMDYLMRRCHCKHILMILLKVYRVPYSHRMFKSLSITRDQRLEARVYSRAVDPSILVPDAIRQKILNIGFVNHPDTLSSQDSITRRPLDTSDCPICFEEFLEEDLASIDFCKTCGNNVHNECFKMWSSTKGSNVTCVFCRSSWVAADSIPRKNNVRQLDSTHVFEIHYANYADELGLSRKRDTSTYSNLNYE